MLDALGAAASWLGAQLWHHRLFQATEVYEPFGEAIGLMATLAPQRKEQFSRFGGRVAELLKAGGLARVLCADLTGSAGDVMKIPPWTIGSQTIQAKRSPVSRTVLLPAQYVIHNEVVSGVTLLIAALAALTWANSPWHASYQAFQETMITVSVGRFSLSEDLRHWINDGLMVSFFFVVGLEIKREFVRGELSDARNAALPIAAALGGMVVPVLIFLSIASGEGSRGWGIPMATDIAFALGVLALLGKRIPPHLRIFLLALATVDDIGAIVVIAIFYTAHLSPPALALAALLLGLLLAMRQGGMMRTIAVYLMLVVLFWVAVLKSGVHATIGGVILGALIPAHAPFTRKTFVASAAKRVDHVAEALRHGATERAEAVLGEIEELTRMSEAPLDRLERIVHPWVSFLVLPLFALANAGVALSGSMLREAAASPVTLGVVGGLVIGKLAGIAGFSWLAVQTGIATISKDITWSHLMGVAMLGGIGFTVSLFMTGLAFDEAPLRADAKVGILAASLMAAVMGYAWLYWATKKKSHKTQE
ncbi:Na+/H+ antiporter NhaA [Candidatus Nitrospira nitrificans]|uniref:Na(+)/H(+) antiporter NhaA n=1 Tax=Candidatus Nitrospira nitrificans TaxID=1742973 RepID=A0A0S4LQ86_9BACT|nr:Na+/H+ antiporter NhaA [Candidatus Nitrospira nitrificans]CUS39660.1 Na(+)/H(+) antiporter NhaA [Candidatus Nitrospira nitrificans]